MAETGLGRALQDEGRRATGDKAGAFFDQSAQAFRSALEVYSKADLPQDWARTENALGIGVDGRGRPRQRR